MGNIEHPDEQWCAQCGQHGHTDEDDHGYMIEVAQRRWVELIDTEKQLRGAVEERDTLREALRVINEHTRDPFARRVVAEALASLTAHGGQ